ncbi:S8 family peptidase [Lentzea sp. NPDC051213]|uniref:S8 family peptidase n=1 Tax=Lentzea sp. NPDC051213 TaxID=3364126 RepID=UPI00379F59E8
MAAGMAVALVAGTTSTTAAVGDTGRQADGTWVTLITGDRVTLDHSGEVAGLVAGPGRTGMAVTTRIVDGHRHVVPADAGRLISEGRLDPRLFDVTELARDGHRAATPLIVKAKPGRQRTAAMQGLTVERDLPAAGMVAMTATDPAAAWRAITDPGSSVGKVWLDATYQVALDRSTVQIGAPQAWQEGYTGKGVKVAVLDSGVDETHPDLAGQEVAAQNFTDNGVPDVVGHGTHVASTIAGTGAKSGGKYRGVAPGASILDGKVLNDRGMGRTSWILEAMDWAAAQGADIVNMSLGGTDSPGIDPVEEAIGRLSAQGVLFVVAAGNDGAPETIGSPASADAALAVGAVDREEKLGEFSSRGPRTGDYGLKPDVTAPGVKITAAKSSASALPDPDGDSYVAMSGTSMATPHVAGAAAILAQRHPEWNGQQLKSALMASAKTNPALGLFDQGSGHVDVPAAMRQTLTAQPPSVSVGTQLWPHDDDQPVSTRITYTNTGSAPLTLALSATASGPGGASPAGMFTVTPTTLTVPAGGTADAVLTSDTRVSAADGTHSGVVLAKGQNNELRTAFSVHREVESYEVGVSHLDGEGKPTTRYDEALMNVRTGKWYLPVPNGAVSTVRVPKGEYFLATTIGGSDQRLVVQPQLRVDGPREVVADGRVARPVTITGPDRAAVPYGFTLSVGRMLGGRQTGSTLTLLNDIDGSGNVHPPLIGQIGPSLPGELRYQVYQHDVVRGTDPVSTYRYVVEGTGRLPDGITREVGARELAEVRRTVGPMREGHVALLSARWLGTPEGAFAPIRVGASRETVDHLMAGSWGTGFLQAVPRSNPVAIIEGARRFYRAGHRYTERVNNAIFAPTMPIGERLGDELIVFTPLWADSQGGRGISAYDTGSTVLYQGDQELGRTTEAGAGTFEVPAGRSKLRLESRGDRSSVADLSTSVSGVWEFSTEHSGDIAKVHLMSVGFAAPLDGANAARPGGVLPIPLSVDLAQGNRRTALRVQASFDDGKNWQPVPVAGSVALVKHPHAEGHVSLKVFAADNRGNSVEETIIRAYRLAK